MLYWIAVGEGILLLVNSASGILVFIKRLFVIYRAGCKFYEMAKGL